MLATSGCPGASLENSAGRGCSLPATESWTREHAEPATATIHRSRNTAKHFCMKDQPGISDLHVRKMQPSATSRNRTIRQCTSVSAISKTVSSFKKKSFSVVWVLSQDEGGEGDPRLHGHGTTLQDHATSSDADASKKWMRPRPDATAIRWVWRPAVTAYHLKNTH